MPRTSSSRAAAALALALASASSVTAAVSGSGGASLTSVSDAGALQTAAAAALNNLLGYYKPNALGVFNQVSTPWHESGIIWVRAERKIERSADIRASDISSA